MLNCPWTMWDRTSMLVDGPWAPTFSNIRYLLECEDYSYVHDEGKSVLITSDVIRYQCQIAHPEWSVATAHDPIQSQQTQLTTFASFEEAPTLITGTNWPLLNAVHIVHDGSTFQLHILTEPEGLISQ
jgi:hypothetical protein